MGYLLNLNNLMEVLTNILIDYTNADLILYIQLNTGALIKAHCCIEGMLYHLILLQFTETYRV